MKPVAWMRRQDERILRITPEKIREDDEPLYTAPRELSDEEIEIIAEALLMIGFKDDFINYDLKEKAQAILKKASEK